MMDHSLRVSVALIAVIAVCAAAYQASSVFAPITIALFVIAVVWPLQSRLERHMPKVLALSLTVLATIAVAVVFAGLAAWGFGRVAQSLLADTARYQALYEAAVAWLEGRGISVAGVWAEHFNVSWMVRAAQEVTGRLNTTLTFWLITFTYIILGLLEVDDVERNVAGMANRRLAHVFLAGSQATAAKLRRYVVVRTQMSIITGVAVWLLAWLAGLQFSAEWGVIAFVLNYIPFIGPFAATILPTVIAGAQFQNWEMPLAIFAGLNAIQFVVGTYVEPRVSGTMLSISPSVVVFAVFFWAFMWGIFGAFIGVPIIIAVLAFCEQDPASRWLAELFGGANRRAPPA